LIVLDNGRARVIEGDYETYQHLVQKERERADKAQVQLQAAQNFSDTGSRPRSPAERPKRKFPYRKSADIEREITDLEQELTAVEDLLGQPATWRDPVKAVGTQQRHGDIKIRLETLYQHWETALEANW
jgi:ATP-binding cassette subfamily F protein 3